jgi:hypothetical protein
MKETMAKAKLRTPVQGLTDKTVGLILEQTTDGTTLVRRTHDHSTYKFTNGQKEHQQRLQKAASYARFAAKVQPIYARLAKGTKRTAYSVAVSDWFNPPVIHEVQCLENKIRVRASDNVRVTKVVIRIRDQKGKLLEAGEAKKRGGDWWEYRPRVSGQILTAEAWDLPGNVTKFVL